MSYLQGEFAFPGKGILSAKEFFPNHPKYSNHNKEIKREAELLCTVYNALFDVIPANTTELKEKAYALRYMVYCLENEGFEDPEKHSSGMETDMYDENACHTLCIYKPWNEVVGTARIILSNKDNWKKSFPMQEVCNSPILEDEDHVKNSCELSRLSLSKKIKREVYKDIPRVLKELDLEKYGYTDAQETELIGKIMSVAILGMCRSLFDQCLDKGILEINAVMTPKHINRLVGQGLVYDQIGDAIDFHGERIPFKFNLYDLFENLLAGHLERWHVASDSGTLHNRAMDIHMQRRPKSYGLYVDEPVISAANVNIDYNIK